MVRNLHVVDFLAFYSHAFFSLTGYNAFMPKFDPATFVTCYIGIAVYLINIFGWKFIKRTKRVKANEMDLVTGRREFEVVEELERLGKEKVDKNDTFMGKMTRAFKKNSRG